MPLRPHLLIFLMSAFFIHSAESNELDPPGTAYSTPLNFCQKNASSAMEQLNDMTLEKINEIKKIKAEINSLRANKNLIDSFIKIRKEYLDSYKALASDSSKKEENTSAKLDHFKTLLKTSLTLNTVNLVATSEKESPNAKSMEQLCKNAKNSKTVLCDYIINKKGDHNSAEIEVLNKTLSNLYLALDASSNPLKIKEELEIIYKNIPGVIAPEKMLGDLLGNSPSLVKALSESEDKQTIMACLANMEGTSSGVQCKKLLDNPRARESVKDILTTEMNTVQKDFSKKKFNDFYSTLDSPQLKTKNLLLTSDFAIYLEKNRDGNHNESKALFDKFKSSCTQIEGKLVDVKDCEESSNEIEKNFEDENTQHENKINEAVKKLDLVISDEGELANIEKMKQYIAQKYLRKCDSTNSSNLSSNIMAPCFRENNFPGDSAPLKQIESKLSDVIGKLQAENPLSSKKGELGIFSKKEIGVYQNYCDNSGLRNKEVVLNICKDINAESSRLSSQKETHEWEKFNKDYYVQYDPVATKGYRVYEKKSNFKILASGLFQSANNIVPIWMNNMQLNYQIDFMTNQALYQKQMMYMNSLDSPWMNLPYFPGSYNQVGNGNLMNQGFNF